MELAREYFLERVRFHARPVLEDLSGQPFRLYLEAEISKPLVGSIWPKLVEGRDADSETKLAVLRKCLISWQKKWHLFEMADAPKWVLATAVMTLSKWKDTQGIPALCVPRESPSELDQFITVRQDYLEELLWWHSHYLSTKQIRPISPPEKMPDYLFDYLLNGKTRDQYLADVRELTKLQLKNAPLSLLKHPRQQAIINAVEEAVVGYCVVVENHCREAGWESDNLRPRLHDHIKWTVKAQILGDTYSDIAKESNREVSTIKRAVESTLSLLALVKRTDFKPGRRHGSKESQDSWRRATRRAMLSE